jgi:hypothetical protein
MERTQDPLSTVSTGMPVTQISAWGQEFLGVRRSRRPGVKAT